jgi:glutathione S-transferase
LQAVDVPPIQLYELTTRDDRRPSPYCWRTKYALAHKGLAFTAVPLGFTELPTRFQGAHKTVPIIDDGGTVVGDSWAIADYLDATYPDRPRLFGSATERALCRFVEASFLGGPARIIMSVVIGDIFDRARDEDRAYFRASREQRLGCTIEEAVATRHTRLEALRAGLEPIRLALAANGGPFLCGAAPTYADYVAAGGLLWPASVTTLPLLRSDDPLMPWLARIQDLYDGLGHKSAMSALAA